MTMSRRGFLVVLCGIAVVRPESGWQVVEYHVPATGGPTQGWQYTHEYWRHYRFRCPEAW